MSLRIQASPRIFSAIDRDGASRLAVCGGMNKRAVAVNRFMSALSEKGTLLTGDRVEEWLFEGFREEGDGIFLYGPSLDGRPFSDCFALPPIEGFKMLKRTIRAFSSLPRPLLAKTPFRLFSAFLLEDDGLLLIPDAVMRLIVQALPAPGRAIVEGFNAFWDPADPDALSRVLGAVAYTITTGSFPFDPENLDGRPAGRSTVYLDPVLRNPDLTPDCSQFILRALEPGRESCPSLAEWADTLDAWIEGSGTRSVPEPERRAILDRGAKRISETIRRNRVRAFVERFGKTILASTSALLIVGVVLASTLSGFLGPSPLKGKSPSDVVESYYGGFNSLDFVLMRRCLSGREGMANVNLVEDVFASRQIMGGHQTFALVVGADVWLDRGRPIVAPPRFVFGILGLEIRRESDDPPVFLVEYRKLSYDPLLVDGLDQPFVYGEWSVLDRVGLERRGDEWRIASLDTLREDRIEIEPPTEEAETWESVQYLP